MASPALKNVETADVKKNTLKINRMPTRSNQRRIEWDVIVPPDTTLDEVMDPAFWGNVAASTFSGPVNFVAVHWEDKSQLLELYVTSYASTYAEMKILRHTKFSKDAKPVRDPLYQIDWSGPETKHRVIRIKDSQLIRDGFEKREDAEEFVKSLPK